MKPTQVAELFANIKNTFVSFFSILMFVALGVGIFLGITWSGPALQNAAQTVFDEGAFHNLQVQFVYGLTDDDLKQLEQVEGVSDVEPARQSFQTFDRNGKSYTIKVQTIGQRINTPIKVEGTLPANANEIALNAVAAERLGIAVGDTIAFKLDGQDKDGETEKEDSEKENSQKEDSEKESSQSSSSNTSGMKYLNSATFTVTALMESPEYVANASATYGFAPTSSGVVHALGWVAPSAFDASAFNDGYPVVNIRCDGLDGLLTYSDEYKNRSSDIEKRVEDLGVSLAESRYKQLHDDAQSKIDDGEKQLQEAKDKVADGEQKIADGEQKIAETTQQLNAGDAQLAASLSQLQKKEAELNSGKKLLAQKRGELQAANQSYSEMSAGIAELQGALDGLNGAIAAEQAKQAQADGQLAATQQNLDKQLKDGKITKAQHDAQLQAAKQTHDTTIAASNQAIEQYRSKVAETSAALSQAQAAAAALKGQIDAGQAEIDKRQAEIDAGSAKLQQGWNQYYAGRNKSNAGHAEIGNAQSELDAARTQVEDGKASIAEKEPKLEDAKQDLANLKSHNWAVNARANNVGSAEITTFAGVTDRLSFSMAALFVIVGLLVSYSAVSRIVHEQITQIGTKKALGLRGGEITLSYLTYSAIAVVAGAIVGVIVGVIAVEGIIGHVLGGMFIFGDYPPYFGIPLFLLITALEMVLVIGATWFACRSILKEHAVELLKGEKPPEAKTRFYEKWGLWERLPLFTQTIVNNCVNDKRRVFSTIVGVTGCTALIVTAITLNNDVLKSFDKQYESIYGYNVIAFADTDVDKALENVEEGLQGQVNKTARVLRKTFILHPPDGDSSSVKLIVPADEESFEKVYQIHSVSGGAFDPSAQGVWVTHAYAKHAGAKVGDTITVEDADGKEHALPILGFHQFYLTYHEIVMGREYYESEFETSFEPNALFVDTGDTSASALEDSLASVKGFGGIIDHKTDEQKNFSDFASVSSTVVLVYLALSALMAIVVLLNLNVMFIEEKKRELIVLMINGFSVKYAKSYIYNDTIVLTIIGIVFGIILGCSMGALSVSSVEPTTALFIKDVDSMAVIVGIVGSTILATIMSLIALRRIPRFSLTDINKF